MKQQAVSPARVDSQKPALPAQTQFRTIEPQEVFRRALWRRPSQEGTIPNAYRREWADAGVPTRWQWFLGILPGPTLEAWLDTNPFSFREVASLSKKDASSGEDPPEWFPRALEGMELSQSPNGNLWVALTSDLIGIVLSNWGAGLALPVARPK